METEDNIGVGVPDTSASAGPEAVEPQSNSISDNGENAVIADPANIFAFPSVEPETVVESNETSATDELDEFQQAIQEQQGDTDLVKKLRGLVKTKYEDFQSRYQQQPQVDPEAAKALELVKDLYGFDTDTGAPTARGFAQKLVQQDLTLAQQALLDLASTEVPNSGIQGYTLAHRFLEQLGLDPYKIEELRQYSRGEISPNEVGIQVDVPDYIPQQYAEAYKNLSEVLRSDVDIYMSSENHDQKAAALQMLQDKSVIIAQERQYEQQQKQAEQHFMQEVAQTVDQNLINTYQGLLDGIKKNPAYNSVKISSNPQVDQTVKDSLIAQINALADPRSVLATQAVRSFEALGVNVDMPKVEQLLSTIDRETEVAVKADKLSKLHNRDYSMHVQQAISRRNNAISQTLALANRYFSEALSAMTKQSNQTINGDLQGGLPNISGNTGFQQNETSGKRSMSQSELADFALNTARQLQNATRQ